MARRKAKKNPPETMNRDQFRNAQMLRRTDFQNVLFNFADLSGLDLSDLNFHNAAFHNANLSDSNLSRSDFSGADLEGANLEKADLGDANLEKAHLAHADLRDARLDGANLRGANLMYADLRGAYLRNVGQISGADFTGAKLGGTWYEKRPLVGAQAPPAGERGIKFGAFPEYDFPYKKGDIIPAEGDLEVAWEVIESTKGTQVGLPSLFLDAIDIPYRLILRHEYLTGGVGYTGDQEFLLARSEGERFDANRSAEEVAKMTTEPGFHESIFDAARFFAESNIRPEDRAKLDTGASVAEADPHRPHTMREHEEAWSSEGFLAAPIREERKAQITGEGVDIFAHMREGAGQLTKNPGDLEGTLFDGWLLESVTKYPNLVFYLTRGDHSLTLTLTRPSGGPVVMQMALASPEDDRPDRLDSVVLDYSDTLEDGILKGVSWADDQLEGTPGGKERGPGEGVEGSGVDPFHAGFIGGPPSEGRRAQITGEGVDIFAHMREGAGKLTKNPAQSLIKRCQRLWEAYDAKPTKKNLMAFGRCLGAMKASKSARVKQERRRALRSFRSEMKAQGWKMPKKDPTEG
jgi:uncharacterized protein YjbI with pentapeptide repeats